MQDKTEPFYRTVNCGKETLYNSLRYDRFQNAFRCVERMKLKRQPRGCLFFGEIEL